MLISSSERQGESARWASTSFQVGAVSCFASPNQRDLSLESFAEKDQGEPNESRRPDSVQTGTEDYESVYIQMHN